VISILAMSNQIQWPDKLKSLFAYLSIFNLNLDLMAPECSYPAMPYEFKWGAIMSIPIIAFSCFIGAHLAMYCHKKFVLKRTKKLHNHGHLVVGSSLMAFYFCYLYITKTTLDIFNCSPTDPPDGPADNPYTYLEVTFVRCFEPGGLHYRLLPFAVVFFMLYALGYPAFAAYIILRNRERIMQDQLLRARNVGNTRATNPQNYDFRKRYGKLYYQFKPWHYYWILLILLRKFAIAVCGLMFRRTPVFLLSFTLLILFTSYSAHVRHQPYMSLSERAYVLEKYEADNKGKDSQKLDKRGGKKGISRMASKKTAKAKFEQMSDVAVASKHRREQAAAYFWNYNAVETTLLTCAILVVLMGLMFQSDQIVPNSMAELSLLTMGFLVIVGSMLYFGAVLATEILLGLGIGEKYITYCLKVKKKEKEVPVQKADEDELTMVQNHTMNPMNSGVTEEKGVSEASTATISALQEEVKMLKKKVQASQLSSFASGKDKHKAKKGQKKTFAQDKHEASASSEASVSTRGTEEERNDII